MTNRIQALQQTALFGSLAMSDLEALSSHTVEHTLKKGEILFIAGDAATGLYVVVNGAIRAYRVGADGREQVIHVERSGATLAEVPVFDGGPYPSTTAADEDSTLLFIRKEHVVQLCLNRPSISLAALNCLPGAFAIAPQWLRTCRCVTWIGDWPSYWLQKALTMRSAVAIPSNSNSA